MEDLSEDSIRKLQADVTDIKNALLGTEFDNKEGLIKKVKNIEDNLKSTDLIVYELNRWKGEAQKWKDIAAIKIRSFERIIWKMSGIVFILSVTIPIIWSIIKVKMGL